MKLRVMLIDESEARANLLEDALSAEGYEIVARVRAGINLYDEVEAVAPDIVIIDMDSPDRDMLEQMRTLHDAHPRPVVMFANDDDAHMIRDAVRAGVSAYVVDGLSRERVRPILEVAIARFNEFQHLRQELAQTRTTLEERKLIDRAKGILMDRRGLSESEAYDLLRKKAMDSNRKLADIARTVLAAVDLLG